MNEKEINKVITDLVQTLDNFANALDTQKEFNIAISNKVLELENKINK